MRAVNLLPRDETQGRQRPSAPVLVACLGTVLVTAALAATYLSASSNVGQARDTLNGLNAELAATPAPAAPDGAAGRLPGERTQRIAALSSALAGRIAWDRVLRELSQVLPADVWLTTLAANGPNAASSPGTFQVTGYTYSQDGVARLLTRLQVLPTLTGVQLASSTGQKLGARDVVGFTINATVKVPGAAS